MSRRLLLALIGALVGAALGGGAAPRYGADFEPPQSVDPAEWSVVIPGWSEGVVSPDLGRGTHVQSGALEIGRYAFDRSDRLLPVNQAAVGGVELTLAPDSGAMELIFRGPYNSAQRAVFVRLRPDSALVPGQQERWEPRAPGPFRFEIRDGEVLMVEPGGETSLGQTGPGTIEMTGVEGAARVEQIRIDGRDGSTLLDADYRARGAVDVDARPWVAGGGLAGASLGLAFAAGIGSGLFAAAWLLPPVVTLRVSAEGWLGWVEALYLTKTPAWDLAEGAFAAAWIPLLALGLLHSGLLVVTARARRQKPWPVWIIAAGIAAAVGSRGWDGPLWVPVVGAIWLALPARSVGAARGRVVNWLARDAPALIAVAVGGWGLGLLFAAGWRLVLVASNARVFLDRAPRAASDLLFASGLALLPAAEIAIRDTYLGEGWDPARLAGADGISREQNWRDLQAFWSGTCGDGSAAQALSLVFTGGSSTGGAYQFGDEPGAFFPARVHAALCEALPPGVALTTWNFGEGGRNTFTISRTLDALLSATGPDLVVMYVGVNDLLTKNDTLTRKQREEVQASNNPLVQALAGRSRLVTGLALGLQPAENEGGERVAEVPLDDAAENLEQIAGGLGGVPLLLSSQHVSAEVDPMLAPYWELEQQIAADHDNARYVDVRPQLQAAGGADLLVDRNHLSREGNQALADALAPEVAAILGLTLSAPP